MTDAFLLVRRAFEWVRPFFSAQRVQRYVESPIFVRLLVLAYSVGFSFFSIVRYHGLQTFAWDMGLYNQAIYTTVFDGRLLYYTADLPANPTGSLLGLHFSPILFALIPFYLLYPDPAILLVIQAVVLALGVLPLYYYALDKLGERRTPVVFSVAYLLSPLIVGINWFDFHPEAFLPLAILSALYFSSRKNWLRYFACILVALASIEAAPVMVAGLGLYLFWIERRGIRRILWMPALRNSTLLVPIATVLLSAGWAFIAFTTIRSLNPGNFFYFGGSRLYFGVLGARTLTDVPIRAVTEPVNATTALLTDWWLKILYLLVLFAPLLFLSLRYLTITVLTVPWLGVALLSNYQPFYFSANQYPSFVAPFIFLGAVEGLTRLKISNSSSWRNPRKVRKRLLVAAFVSFAVATPIFPWLLGLGTPPTPYGVFSAESHEGRVAEILSLIPSDASVLTQSNIFPLVSSRVEAYVVPTVSLFPPGMSFNQTLDTWLLASEYVVLDPETDLISTLLTLSRLRLLGSHGIIAQADNTLLFKKAYFAAPLRFEPRLVRFDWTNLGLYNGIIAVDPSSTSGKILLQERGTDGLFWNSPDLWLPPGEFLAAIRLKADSGWMGSLLRVDLVVYSISVAFLPIGDSATGFNYRFSVQKQRQDVVSLWLSSGNFTSGSFQDVPLAFESEGLATYSLEGVALSSATSIYLDQITLLQKSPR